MIHALHGNFGLPSDWDAALPPGVPAKAWHLWEIRRHHPETHTLSGFAAWFNNQITALPPDPCRILAGYSLGGRLALHVLADRPLLWHRVLLLSTHPGLANETGRSERLVHDLSWQIRSQQDPWVEVCDSWTAQPVLQGPGTPPDLLPMESWRQEIAGAFDGWSLGRQQGVLAFPGALKIRGGWMTGGADSKFSELALKGCGALPGFIPETVPHAGHRLLTSHPDAVGAALARLLRQAQG